MNNYERFGFVPQLAYQQLMSSVYYGAMTMGNSKLITYSDPRGLSELVGLAAQADLEVVKNDDSDFIIAEIISGLTKVYSCNYDCTLAVISHFEGG